MKLLISIAACLIAGFLSGQTFREVSNERGIAYHYPGNDYQEVGAGVTIIDVNNDGWDDVFQSGGLFPSKLWLNKKGTFIDATSDYGFDQFGHLYIQAVKAGDFDNDGFEDLFICNQGGTRGDHSPPVLLKNVAGQRFEVAHQEAFTKLASYPDATWGDINKDGFIDLYVLAYVASMSHKFDSLGTMVAYDPQCLPNLFFMNQGGNGFEEVSASFGINDSGCGLAGSFTDFDNDNDMDLIVLNDFGSWSHKGNRIYRNNFPENSFTDISDPTGFYQEFYGMGVGVGDYDNNGFFDYYVTNIGRNSFFKNLGSESFEDVSEDLGLDIAFETPEREGTSWSGLFFDADNDGDVDLYVTRGYLNSIVNVAVKDQNKLFINKGDGTFENRSIASTTNDSLASRGAATFDFDHDGDLDLITGVIKMQRGEFGSIDQKIKLFENITANKNQWIGLKLVGGNGVNKSCIGCSVTLTAENKKHIREVDGGSGHSSQSSKVLYFGLGSDKIAKDIEIQWLGQSNTTTIQELKAGKVYEVYQNGQIKKYY